jgi:hypothetical protein
MVAFTSDSVQLGLLPTQPSLLTGPRKAADVTRSTPTPVGAPTRWLLMEL